MTWLQFVLSTIGASLVTAVALITQGALAARRERKRDEKASAVRQFEELRGVHLEMLNALVEFWRVCDLPARTLEGTPAGPAMLAVERRITMPDSARLDAAYSALLVYVPRPQVDVAGEAMRWAGRLAELLVAASHPTGPYPLYGRIEAAAREAEDARKLYADLVHREVGPSRH